MASTPAADTPARNPRVNATGWPAREIIWREICSFYRSAIVHIGRSALRIRKGRRVCLCLAVPLPLPAGVFLFCFSYPLPPSHLHPLPLQLHNSTAALGLFIPSPSCFHCSTLVLLLLLLLLLYCRHNLSLCVSRLRVLVCPLLLAPSLLSPRRSFFRVLLSPLPEHDNPFLPPRHAPFEAVYIRNILDYITPFWITHFSPSLDPSSLASSSPLSHLLRVQLSPERALLLPPPPTSSPKPPNRNHGVHSGSRVPAGGHGPPPAGQPRAGARPALVQDDDTRRRRHWW